MIQLINPPWYFADTIPSSINCTGRLDLLEIMKYQRSQATKVLVIIYRRVRGGRFWLCHDKMYLITGSVILLWSSYMASSK